MRNSTVDSNSSSNFNKDTRDLLVLFINNLNLYGLPIICIVGLVGNCLSIIIFSSKIFKQFRNQTCSAYLSALAVSDTFILITLFLSWLGLFGINLVHYRGFCQLIPYVTFVCSFLSTWIVCIFTFERFFAVFFPLKLKLRSSRRGATKVLFGLVLFALFVFPFPLWSYTVRKGMCVHKLDYKGLIEIMNAMDALVTLCIPFLIIVPLNIAIAVKLAKYVTFENLRSAKTYSESRTRSMTTQDDNETELQPLDNEGENNKVRHQRHSKNLQRKSAKLLIVIATAFFLLSTPSYAFKLYVILNQDPDNRKMEIPAKMRQLQEIFQVLYYINFAINFFLYSLSSSAFRAALKQLLSIC